MKKNILIVLLLSTSICFAQNKKEQIEILNLKIDSCKTVILNQTVDLNSKKIEFTEIEQKLIQEQLGALEKEKLINEFKAEQINLINQNKSYTYIIDSLKLQEQKRIIEKDKLIAELMDEKINLISQNKSYVHVIDSLKNELMQTSNISDITVFWFTFKKAIENKNTKKLKELTFYPFLGHSLYLNSHTHDELLVEKISEFKSVKAPVKSLMSFYGGDDVDGKEITVNFSNGLYEVELNDGTALYFSNINGGFKYVGYLYGE